MIVIANLLFLIFRRLNGEYKKKKIKGKLRKKIKIKTSAVSPAQGKLASKNSVPLSRYFLSSSKYLLLFSFLIVIFLSKTDEFFRIVNSYRKNLTMHSNKKKQNSTSNSPGDSYSPDETEKHVKLFHILFRSGRIVFFKKIVTVFFLPLLLFAFNENCFGQVSTHVYRVAIDMEYEPYEFLNDKNEAEGFTPSLLKEIEKTAGVSFEFIPMYWPFAIQALEKGDIDIVSMIYSPERAALYEFSNPHSQIAQALFRNSNMKNITDTVSLKGHTIGFENSDISFQKMAHRTDFTIRLFDTKANGLLHLNIGNIDAFFIPQVIGFHFISEYKFYNIEFVKGNLFTQDFCFAARKGNRQLIKLLNTHLAKLQSSGRLHELNDKWLKGKPITPSWFEKNQNLLFSIGGILSVSLVLLLLWNKTLQRRVLDRTKTLQESEKNLSITLHSIGDAVISTDVEGNVQRMNPVAEKLCGWAFTEANGKPLTEVFKIISAETRKPVDNPVTLVMETGAIVGLANHTLLISKDGSEYQIADSAAPIKNKEGKIGGIILVFSDVTEKYASQEALKESEVKFRFLVENATDIVFTINLEGFLTYISPSIKKFGGYDEIEILGKHFSFLFAEKEQLELALPIFQQIVIKREATTYQFLFLPKDRDTFWIEVIGNPIVKNENVIGFHCVMRNIEERKQAEEKIKAQLNELKKWHATTIGREERIIEMKKEVNALLEKLGQQKKYNM